MQASSTRSGRGSLGCECRRRGRVFGASEGLYAAIPRSGMSQAAKKASEPLDSFYFLFTFMYSRYVFVY